MQYRVSYRSGGGGYNLGPIGYIIGINVLMLLVTSFFPNIRIELGLIPQRVFDDPLNSWTMITNMFIHAGFFHLLANMLTLYFFGSHMMAILGKTKFLLLYFISGLVGNLFYLWLGEPISIAVGASGAVFGIAGALTVLRPKLTVFIIPIPVPIPLWVAVLGGFGLMSIPVIGGNIAWQAHLGGLLVGLIVGYLVRQKRNQVIFFQ